MRYVLALLIVLFLASVAQAQMGHSYYNWLLSKGRTVEAQAYLGKIQVYNQKLANDPTFKAQEAQKIRQAQIFHQKQQFTRRSVVGYAPVIRRFPSGTQLSASVVVSPDRRYVRFGGTAMFSGIGQVNTFTYYRRY